MAAMQIIHEIGDFGYPEEVKPEDRQKLDEQFKDPDEKKN